MALLVELEINIFSNYGDRHVVFDEIVFKDDTGNTLPNTGVVLTSNSNFNSSGWELQKLLNGLYSSGGNVQGWASLMHPTYPVWLKCVFPSGFDCASVTLVNRGDGDDYATSPKDITITAFFAGYENKYTLSATRPSDAAGASTTHNLADAAVVPIIRRGLDSMPLRLAPSANHGAPGTRAAQITVARQDQSDGGAYRLSGVVTSSGAPVSRRVRLFAQTSGRMVRETWSSAVTGAYSFDGIRAGTFFVLAHDHTGQFDPEAKADLQSEPMP